jgi:hypothetical protein
MMVLMMIRKIEEMNMDNNNENGGKKTPTKKESDIGEQKQRQQQRQITINTAAYIQAVAQSMPP